MADVYLYIGTPLAWALRILEPYPWKSHVELVLYQTWGEGLPEIRAKTEEVFKAAAQLRRTGLEVRLNELQRRVFEARLGARYGLLRASANTLDPFAGAAGLLLPIHRMDQFDLYEIDATDDGDGIDRDAPLRFTDTDGYRHVLMLTQATVHYRIVRDWMTVMRNMVVDIVDSDRIIRRASSELKRTYEDVVRSIYPSAVAVFKLQVTGRPPIARDTLRSVVHPDDQEVIRTVLDQAAGGRTVPDRDLVLQNFELTYPED